MVSDLPRAAQSWQSSLEAGTHSAFPVRHTLHDTNAQEPAAQARAMGPSPATMCLQEHLLLPGLFQTRHPSGGDGGVSWKHVQRALEGWGRQSPERERNWKRSGGREGTGRVPRPGPW